jgi:hypothetical protein
VLKLLPKLKIYVCVIGESMGYSDDEILET